MADEKKTVKKEDTSKAEKKTNPIKKVGNFFVKIGKAIAKFFKDLKGETKKIVWPGRHMVLKSTGIVLAAILVIGAVIWLLDFAVSGAVKGLSNIGNNTEVTETVSDEDKEDHEGHDHADEDKTEKTTEKE
jgi:preprotein translocase subunit SecE